MRGEWRFEPERSSPGAARHRVTDALTGHADGELGDCVRLIVSELATNAVLHARTPFWVRVDLDDHHLRLEVRDGDRGEPKRSDFSSSAVTGRGLGLVEIYSDRWGSEALPDGKVVWCELDLPWKGVGDG
jgi:hypothetical protein